MYIQELFEQQQKAEQLRSDFPSVTFRILLLLKPGIGLYILLFVRQCCVPKTMSSQGEQDI